MKTRETAYRTIVWTLVLCLVLGTGGAAARAEQPEESPAPQSVSAAFYDADGSRLVTVQLLAGTSLREANAADAGAFYPLSQLKPKAAEGHSFRYWYTVSEQLSGNAGQPYDLSAAVHGDLRLMAHYEQLATETPVPATETPEPATQTPTPAAETPAPETVAPALAAETSMPVTETPAYVAETPVPVTATPAPQPEAMPGMSASAEGLEPLENQAPVTDKPSDAPADVTVTQEPATDAPLGVPVETPTVPEHTADAPSDAPEETPAAQEPAADAPSDAPTSVSGTQAPLTDIPTGEPGDAAMPATDAPPADTPNPGSQELVSETEVDTFLVRFYGADDAELYAQPVKLGDPVPIPLEPPAAPQGQAFAHWYAVDAQLAGDASQPYDFSAPVVGLTRLKAAFLPEAAPETPAPTTEVAETAHVAFAIQASLVLEGQDLIDGAYQARLTGPGMADGLTVSNAEGLFTFPALQLPAAPAQHAFKLHALVLAPQSGYIYDLNEYTILVQVAQDAQGVWTARVQYPQGANGLTMTHTYQGQVPTVRVYLQRGAGQALQLGDEVRFLAETLHCGNSPALQWQFSKDNVTWTDIPGATGNHLDMLLTAGNALGYWRVAVTITD